MRALYSSKHQNTSNYAKNLTIIIWAQIQKVHFSKINSEKYAFYGILKMLDNRGK